MLLNHLLIVFLTDFQEGKIKHYIQGVPLILVQTLRGGRGHEDKHYSVGNHGAQTSSVGAMGR